MKIVLLLLLQLILTPSLFATNSPPVNADPLLNVMQDELDRSVNNLTNAGEAQVYYMAYSVADKRTLTINAENGGMLSPQDYRDRHLDVDVRVGSMELDNTHEIRGGTWRDNYTRTRIIDFPLELDSNAMRSILGAETEFQYRKSQERLTKVKTNRQVKVEETDLSDDFSPTTPNQYVESFITTDVDMDYWSSIVKKTSEYVAGFPFVIQ